MPKSGRDRKRDNHRKKARTGARFTSINANTTHRHPGPDMSILEGLPYAAGRPVDLAMAGAVVGACRAGCRPCLDSLIPKLLQGDRATVAVLAGAVYGLVPTTGGPLASAVTRAWVPKARAAHDSGDGSDALGAVDAMLAGDVAALLDDALDHWAAGGADPEDPPVRVITPADLGLDATDFEAPEHPVYGVIPGTVALPDGKLLPSLTLYPETPGGGIEDLRRRTGWSAWPTGALPGLDYNWRVRVDIATRSLTELVSVDADGWDDLVLWRAAETVTLPPYWWDVLDRSQRMLVAGPNEGDADALKAAVAGSGELLAVVVPVSFL